MSGTRQTVTFFFLHLHYSNASQEQYSFRCHRSVLCSVISPLQCHHSWFMFLEFVKDEATAAEAKLKLHLSPAHIISSAAGEK